MDKEASISYNHILRQIIAEIKSTRAAVAMHVNTSVMQMYWNIGKQLSEEGLEKGYGASVVEKLSVDLKNEFPDTTGFSPRNLWDMKRFYEFYNTDDKKLPQAVAVLPWGHHRLILSKIKNQEEARFYVESAVEMSWTRDILLNFIKADAYKNAKRLPKHHNFKKHESCQKPLLLLCRIAFCWLFLFCCQRQVACKTASGQLTTPCSTAAIPICCKFPKSC